MRCSMGALLASDALTVEAHADPNDVWWRACLYSTCSTAGASLLLAQVGKGERALGYLNVV